MNFNRIKPVPCYNKDSQVIKFIFPSSMMNKEYLLEAYFDDIRFSSNGMLDGANIDINITDINILPYLKDWFDIVYNKSIPYKSEIVGRIIIESCDKTGLVYRTVSCENVLINTYENEEIIGTKLDFYEASFSCEYYLEEASFSCEKYLDEFERIEDKPGGCQDSVYPIGYHLSEIKKGVLGEISKIEEELNELKDAEKQGSKIMTMVELSDMYGAIEEYAKKYEITMTDLKSFSDITKRAFKNGHRK